MSSDKKKSAQTRQETKLQLIYCGPNLPKLGLNHSTTYIGGYPKHLEKHFEKCPAIKRLFVPIDRLSHTLQAISSQGTAESVWYNEVLAYAKGGVE